MTTTTKIYKCFFPYDAWTDWKECKIEDVPATLKDFKATDDLIGFKVEITINVKGVKFDKYITIYNAGTCKTNEDEFQEFWDLIKKFQ